MWKWLKIGSLISLISIFAIGCQDKADDPYFARPDDLPQPIYQELDARGNFTMYLKLAEKSGYADVLKRSGAQTVFAPNDQAFAAYLGKKSIDDISVEEAKSLIAYSIVTNAFQRASIDDAFTGKDDYAMDVAYRRKTKYLKGAYFDTDTNRFVIDANKVFAEEDDIEGGSTAFDEDEPGYKRIPIFTPDFMDKSGIGEADYSALFPSSSLNGETFNVCGAQVKEMDVFCENGFVNELDKVIEPLKNLEEILKEKPQYSLFRGLLNKHIVRLNGISRNRRENIAASQGITEYVYSKTYPFMLYSPNSEVIEPNSTIAKDQYVSYTMFVPNNESLQKFLDEKFLTYYPSLDVMSSELIADFINSQLKTDHVWPTKINEWTDYNTEDIDEVEMASNGIFYGANKVIESNQFFSVYGEINLNPEYSLMKQALKTLMLDYTIMNKNYNYTIFLLPNSVFANEGFSYDYDRSVWSYAPEEGNVATHLNRFVKMHIVDRVISNFDYVIDGERFVESYIHTLAGEYVKYEDQKLFAAGNIEEGSEVFIDYSLQDTSSTNGVTYKFADTPLRYSNKSVMQALIDGGYKLMAEFIYYNEDLYDREKDEIKFISSDVPNTLFAISDRAIQYAQYLDKDEDGNSYLPPTINPTGVTEKGKVKNFFSYHLLYANSIIKGSGTSGQFLTGYKTEEGRTTMQVLHKDGSMVVVDRSGREVYVSSSVNNILANKIVIHELDHEDDGIHGYLSPKEPNEE